MNKSQSSKVLLDKKKKQVNLEEAQKQKSLKEEKFNQIIINQNQQIKRKVKTSNGSPFNHTPIQYRSNRTTPNQLLSPLPEQIEYTKFNQQNLQKTSEQFKIDQIADPQSDTMQLAELLLKSKSKKQLQNQEIIDNQFEDQEIQIDYNKPQQQFQEEQYQQDWQYQYPQNQQQDYTQQQLQQQQHHLYKNQEIMVNQNLNDNIQNQQQYQQQIQIDQHPPFIFAEVLGVKNYHNYILSIQKKKKESYDVSQTKYSCESFRCSE